MAEPYCCEDRAILAHLALKTLFQACQEYFPQTHFSFRKLVQSCCWLLCSTLSLAEKMVFVKFSLLLAVCLALSYALPVQQFRKTGNGKNGGNSTRVSGTYGIDLSSYFDESDFECLKSNSYEFAIIRGYQSIGEQ